MGLRMLLPRLLAGLGGKLASRGIGTALTGSKIGSTILPWISKGGKLGPAGSLLADILGLPAGQIAGEALAGQPLTSPSTALKENLGPALGFAAGTGGAKYLGSKLPGTLGRAVGSVPSQLLAGALTAMPLSSLLDSDGVALNDNASQIEGLGNSPLATLSTMIAQEKLTQGIQNAELATALSEFGINLDDLAPMLSTDRFQQVF